MSILHMQTEELRTVGQQLLRASDDVYHQAQRLESSLQHLFAVWQGTSSSDFAYAINPQVQALHNQANNLARLAHQLQKEIDEWEYVDRYFL